MGKYFFRALAVISGIVLADQYTKWLMVETVLRKVPSGADFWRWLLTVKEMAFSPEEYEQFKAVEVFPGLDFVMVWNRGISFGMLDPKSSSFAWVFIILSSLIALLLTLWLAVANRKAVAASLSLIIGGALANVWDRVRFGAVADFIDIYAGSWHWPAFNLADSCITIGAGILMADAFINKDDGVKKK